MPSLTTITMDFSNTSDGFKCTNPKLDFLHCNMNTSMEKDDKDPNKSLTSHQQDVDPLEGLRLEERTNQGRPHAQTRPLSVAGTNCLETDSFVPYKKHSADVWTGEFQTSRGGCSSSSDDDIYRITLAYVRCIGSILKKEAIEANKSFHPPYLQDVDPLETLCTDITIPQTDLLFTEGTNDLQVDGLEKQSTAVVVGEQQIFRRKCSVNIFFKSQEADVLQWCIDSSVVRETVRPNKALPLTHRQEAGPFGRAALFAEEDAVQASTSQIAPSHSIANDLNEDNLVPHEVQSTDVWAGVDGASETLKQGSTDDVENTTEGTNGMDIDSHFTCEKQEKSKNETQRKSMWRKNYSVFLHCYHGLFIVAMSILKWFGNCFLLSGKIQGTAPALILILLYLTREAAGIKTCKQTFTIDGIFQMPLLIANSSMMNTHLSVIDVCPRKTFCYGSLFVCFTNESSMAFYFTEKNFGPCYISYAVNYESNEKALEFSNKDCGERFANNPEAYGPMTASVTTITIPAEPSENGPVKWGIILIAVFVSIGLTGLNGVIYFCCRRRCRKKARTSDSNGRTPTPLDQTGSPADVYGKRLNNNSEEMPKGHDANEPLQDTEV